MEWLIPVVFVLGGGLLVHVARRLREAPMETLKPLPRGPIGELPAGGMYTFGHLFHFDGVAWTSVLDAPPATEPVVQIDGSALGTFCVTWDGIYRRTQTGWVREHHSATRLLSLRVTDTSATVGGAHQTLLQRGDDGTWTQMPLPELPACVLGPIAQSMSGLFVGGNDFVLHARDSVWVIEEIPTEDVLMDACVHGKDVWFAVQSGQILRSNGDGQWTVEHTASHGIGGITCAPDGTLFAVGGTGNVLSSSGDGRWSEVGFEGESQLLCVRVIDGVVCVGDIAGRIHIRGPRQWMTFQDDARCEVRDIYGTAEDMLVATSSFYTT